MTTDFSKYQKIIANFRGEVSKPTFDIKFTQSTKQIAKTEKFLLKMELKRLASACTRSIDLRGLVDGDCKLFEYGGQSHFLDEVALDVFEQNVDAYKGYTFGVYESVKNTENNFRVIYQKEQKISQLKSKNEQDITESPKKTQDKTQYPVTLFPLNQYQNRVEERMNFVTSLVIILENKQKKSVSSIDVSVSGVKFRLNNKEPLYIDQQLTIIFKGIEEDFQFGKDDALVYQVKNIQSDANTQLIGCQRVDVSDDDAFAKFLLGYIQGNKRRYKVNLENTISALQARTFEQYVLPRLNELPIFFEHSENGVFPRYALTTNNNQPVFQYWQDEENHSNLQFLLNEERLVRLLKKYKQGKSLLVYSFIHQNQGKDFFYTIDEAQLPQDDSFFQSFLTFAAKKSSFAITMLTYFDVDKLNTYSPFTLSNTQDVKKQYINLPPSAEVLASVDSLSFSVVASDITHQTAIEQYQKFSNDEIDVNKLRKFGHKRLKEKLNVEELGVTYKNQRQESRYIYSTPTVLECKKVQWQGTVVDFSISGLKVELGKHAMLAVGEIIEVSFPSLQKITSAYDLKKLPYEVVKINKKKTVLNLRVIIKEHQHVGRSFFKLLINKNKDKLITDEYTLLVPGLEEALRTHYAQQMQVPALIVQTSGSRYKIEALVSNDNGHEFLQQLKNLSDRKNYYNFYPIMTKLYKDNFLESCLKKLIVNEESITEVLYIALFNKVEQIEQSVKVKFAAELETIETRESFIKHALEKGLFFCFQLKISRTSEPNIEHLNAELSYISSYAIHRSKQIEQEIWSVVATIQYIDITHEVLFSHGL
ncbi:MAG: PilZ domain-containing protein [Colwellia sp.]|nr:PilZ domain-containing protein [Colwellia sp.]